MRKAGWVSAVIIAVVVVALAGAWLLLDVNKYRETIQAQIEPQLGREVSLGNMSLGLFPLRFQVEQPVIAEDPAFGTSAPFVSADKLDVQVRLLPLLGGNVEIKSIELQRPFVELVLNKDGIWNFSTLGGAKPTEPAPDVSAGEGRAFSLGRLAVHDGQVAVTDLQRDANRTVYDHIDLTLQNYVEGEPFSFDLGARIQGEAAQEIHLSGDAGPIAPRPLDTPFDGALTVQQVQLEGLKQFLASEMFADAAGTLSGETRMSNQAGKLTAVGSLQLDKARIGAVDFSYPIGIEYDLGMTPADQLLTVNNGTIRLGPTPLSATGTVNLASTPPILDLKVTSGDVSVAEIARLSSAFGVAFAPGTNVSGRVSADVQITGSASEPALNGTVSGRDLNIAGPDVPQPVEVKSLDIALSPKEIRSNEFNATSGQTTVAARFALRDYTSPAPSVDVGLRAPNASLPEIKSIAKAYGLTGLDQINGAGGLNMDLRATGPLKSASTTDLIRALNGTINLDFSPLQVAGFDAEHELGAIGGFASAIQDKNLTEVVRLTGQIVVKNGVAQTDNLQAALAIGNIAAKGTADLATETLDLRVAAVMSKAFSGKVGGTGVGGYLQTALANTAGELVIPAIVTGTFKEPKFAPDSKAFVQMQRQRLLPTFDSPASAVSGILGALTNQQKDTGQEPAAGQKPADTVRGILGGFLGGQRGDPK